MLYSALLNDDGALAKEVLAYPEGTALPVRTALARAILLRANDPHTALAVAEQLADRLEGRPVHQSPSR